MKSPLVLVLSLVGALFATYVQAEPKCFLGYLSAKDYDLFMCIQRSSSAHSMASIDSMLGKSSAFEVPDCVLATRKRGTEWLEKTKVCLRKNKSSDALKALSEYWVVWIDLVDAMESGPSDWIRLKHKEAERTQRAVEALLP